MLENEELIAEVRELLRSNVRVCTALLDVLSGVDKKLSEKDLPDNAQVSQKKDGESASPKPQSMPKPADGDTEGAKEKQKEKPKNAPVKAKRQMPLSVTEKVNQLLNEILFGTANGENTKVLENDVRLLAGKNSNIEIRISEAKRRGAERRKEQETLNRLLKNDVCHKDVQNRWRYICEKVGWFRKAALKNILWKYSKDIQRICQSEGIEKARDYQQRALKVYGQEILDIPLEPQGKKQSVPTALRGTVHTLWSREPAEKWDIYIDETGTRFSEAEEGTEGCVVAVCVHSSSPLRDPGSFHATEASPQKVLTLGNELLESDCGLFGLSRSALNIQSQEGWLQAIHELCKWVWRLLPLKEGKIVSLCFHVEQRSSYGADMPTDFGEKLLIAELTRENPQRAERIHVSSFEFSDKETPMLAWADVLANIWAKNDSAKRRYMKDSGLSDTCLLSCDARTLQICEKIFRNEMPEGEEWVHLMRSRVKKGSLQDYALKRMQARCMNDSVLWKDYVHAMQQYLLQKQYTLGVLDRMSEWLGPMETEDFVVRFFWNMAELARFNHSGEVGSEALQKVIANVETLAPEVSKIDPMASLHAALRLSVSESNAFDFGRAETCLLPWNPYAGGKLTGSAIWDGKILSSLGQYRCFQNDPVGGIRFFTEALQHFEALGDVDSIEAERQLAQTRTYLAIAKMDCMGEGHDGVKKSVEDALGMSVEEASKLYGKGGIPDNPYPHFLLARYLAYVGTEEERACYLRTRHLWTDRENGMGQGHPWPQIQYFRWLMLDDDDSEMQKDVAGTLIYARGKDNMPTVDLIVTAIGLSMGLLKSGDENVRALLLQLDAQMPKAHLLINQLLAAPFREKYLAKDVIPFNYC